MCRNCRPNPGHSCAYALCAADDVEAYCSKECKDKDLLQMQREYNKLGRAIAARTNWPYPPQLLTENAPTPA